MEARRCLAYQISEYTGYHIRIIEKKIVNI